MHHDCRVMPPRPLRNAALCRNVPYMPSSEQPTERWLTTQDLADRYKVHPKTVRKWRSDKTGPAGQRIGGQTRYRLADVIEWEQSQQVAS